MEITIKREEFYAYSMHLFIEISQWNIYTRCKIMECGTDCLVTDYTYPGIRPLFLTMFIAHNCLLDQSRAIDEFKAYVRRDTEITTWKK